MVDKLTLKMEEAAREMQFERAAELRDCIRDIEGLMARQNASQVTGIDQDVIAAAQDGLDAMAQVLLIRGGKMIAAESFALPGKGQSRCPRCCPPSSSSIMRTGNRPGR